MTQVDRLLSNSKLSPWVLMATWAPSVVAERTEVVLALDWTDFDDDDQATICINLLTSHGRAAPLVWHASTKKRADGQSLGR